MWQGKAASKLHTHKRVAGGHPHLSPPSPCQRRARCPAAAAHRWLCQMREQWGATGPGPTIRGQAPLSPVWQVGWHSAAHSWGEGWGGSGNICKWGGLKKKPKKKGKPNSSAVPQQLVLVWKPAGLRLRAPVWGKLARLHSRRPPTMLVIAQWQAACSGTHAGCEVGTMPPHHPARGRVR